MTILRVAPRVPPCSGGKERHVLELTREQAAAGHRVVLVYAEGDPGQGPNWESHRIQGFRGGLPDALELLRFGRALRRWLGRNPVVCDLVHTHGDYVDAITAVAIARRVRCPAVLTLHGSWSASSGLRDRLRRWAFNRLDHLFCVSHELEAQLRALGVRIPITVQHSGTRLGPLTAIPREPMADPTVVAVGNLLPVKGYADLIGAVGRLAPEWPELRVEVLGDGPLREELTAAAAGLPQLRFVGGVEGDQVYRALRRAWLYVLCSVDLPGSREGLPTALIEAMAAGLPVVATAVGGVSDVVTDGRQGLLVPQRDSAALANAIGRLLRDEALRERMAAASAEAGAACDWSRVAAVFTGICEQLVTARRSRA